MKTLYELLEVSENASKEIIEKAYKVLAKKYHPDLQAEGEKLEAEKKMKQINEAYEVLSDKQKRQMYDQFGHEGPQGFGGQNGGGYYSYGSGFDGFGGFSGFEDFGFGSFGDIFSAAFGGGTKKRNGPRKGADLKLNLEITFEESYKGVEKNYKHKQK